MVKLRQITSVLGILWQQLLCWAMVLHLGVGCPVGCVVNCEAQAQLKTPVIEQPIVLECTTEHTVIPSYAVEPSSPANTVVQLVAWFPMVLILPSFSRNLASQRQQWLIPLQQACSYIVLPTAPPPRPTS